MKLQFVHINLTLCLKFKIINTWFYKHILNIEEVTYVSNFKINIFYFMGTLIYKYINHIIFKSNLCTEKYFTFSHIKDYFFIGFILNIFSI